MPAQIFDDHDAAVVYSRGWGHSGNPSEEYNGTTTFAPMPGLTATLTFRGAAGTMVAVYGTIAAAGSPSTIPPQTSYSIDGSSPATYVQTMAGSTQYRQLYYQSNQLSDGQHTLVITNLIRASVFFLDYFVVTTSDADATMTTSTTATTTTTRMVNTGGVSTSFTRDTSTSANSNSNVTPGSGTVTSVRQASSNSASSTALLLAPSGSTATDAKADSQNHTGTIVGGVIGAIGCVLLLIAIILILQRRRKPASEAAVSRFLDTTYMRPAVTRTYPSSESYNSSPTSGYHSSRNTQDDYARGDRYNQQTGSNSNANNQGPGSRPSSPPAYASEIGPPLNILGPANPYGQVLPGALLPSKLQNEYHRR